MNAPVAMLGTMPVERIVVLVLLSAVSLGSTSCAFLRASDCQRSRDVAASLGVQVHGVGASLSVDAKRTVSSHFDGLLLSFDLLCENHDHMTGAEYQCEVRRHAKAARRLGHHLAELTACGSDGPCRRSSLAEFMSEKRNLEAVECTKRVDAIEGRPTERTTIGSSIPVSGTPHGSAFVVGGGGFATTEGISGDVVIGYGWDSENEIGLSVLRGSNASDFEEVGRYDFFGIRARYTRYFRATRAFKPFVRASLLVTDGEWGVVIPDRQGNIVEVRVQPSGTSIGAAAEGGALYDLTRWLGFYAEVAVGYVAGTETAVVNGSAVDQPGSPILALGFGVHVRVVD